MEGDPKITMDSVRTASMLLAEAGDDGLTKDLVKVMFAVAEFEKYERALHSINERQCNGYCNERTGREDETSKLRDERREESIKKKATDLALVWGVEIWFNGDPRGAAIKMRTPKCGRYNTWGGAEDGWAI